MLVIGWPIILVVTVLSAGAAEVGETLRKPEYTASARLFAVVAGDAGVPAAFQGDRGAVSRIPTYGKLALSDLVAVRTIDQLGLDESPAELRERVSVLFAPQSAVMTVSTTADDEETAIRESTAVAQNLVQVSTELQWADGGPTANLVPVDYPTMAVLARASRLRALAVGASLGLLLSCLALWLCGAARDTVLDKRRLAATVGETDVEARSLKGR
ncbi:hypothetical protein [Mycobacterium sp. NPDC006124]|uniref:hypothetical protein n=1 Tax=Mycobacterium sp. NPDC006124 TaxID=3156729 RepID=UPI0033B6F106